MARFHREETVMRRLDADESSGYAMARFVLEPGDRCWTPNGCIYGPTNSRNPDMPRAKTFITFERLAGQLTVKTYIDGDPYGHRKWGAA